MEREKVDLISEALKDEDLMSEASECTSIDELYLIFKGSLPGICQEEFMEVITTMQAEVLEDEDLECVVGGLKVGSCYITCK